MKLFGATDSLGTVTVDKAADLVLPDTNLLADIRNTQKIAVVANERYFDRLVLPRLPRPSVQRTNKVVVHRMRRCSAQTHAECCHSTEGTCHYGPA